MASQERDAAAIRRDRIADARDSAATQRGLMVNGYGKPSAHVIDLARASARDRELAAEDRRRAAQDREASAHELAREGVDELTGAMRRGTGLAAIQREMDRTLRSGESLTLVFVDVDGLKAINDDRGHLAGDDALRAVARCIAQQARSYDLVVRIGGDEFVAALAGMDMDAAQGRFAEIAPRLAGTPEHPTFTTGFAERGVGDSLEQLLARADASLIARRRGAGRGEDHAPAARLVVVRSAGAAGRPYGDSGPRPADDERGRIVAALHDGPLQLLAAASQDLDRVAAGDDSVVQTVRARIRETIAEIRRISDGDPPADVATAGGLEAALEALCRDAALRGAFTATVRVDEGGSDGVDGDFVLVLAREFVGNAVKHADATRLEVAVRRDGDHIELTVGDDGVGVPAHVRNGRSRPGHLGFRLTAARVADAGGAFLIGEGDDGGTLITVRLPTSA